MITESLDKSHEIYEDVLSLVSQGLQSKVDITKVLECLAVVTFFGANNSYETEQAMQLLWEFILPPACASSKKKEHSPTLLSAAISAWSFLLTSIDGWRLSYKIWKGAISCLSNLLDNEDETVCAAAHEALTLIFETNCLEKFSTGSDDSGKLSAVVISIQNCQNYCDEIIGGWNPKLSTWSQIIQMKFIKQFLGEDGFVKHMTKNRNFHDIFEFSPETKSTCTNMLHVFEREEVQVRFYCDSNPIQEDCSLLPFISKKNKKVQKRFDMSSNSPLTKAKTVLLKKKRAIREAQKDFFIAMD
ncbi:uncharacterized protein LOC120135407 [Hibiscus syriacus]|nr:uncharacterized protein LOC120135407 [Hibiscus syriacus]